MAHKVRMLVAVVGLGTSVAYVVASAVLSGLPQWSSYGAFLRSVVALAALVALAVAFEREPALARAVRVSGVLLACMAGLFATRLLLVLATAPHNVLMFGLRSEWHWPVAAFVGALAGAFSYSRSLRRVVLLTAAVLLAATGVLRAVMDTSFMYDHFPGFWFK
jgi:hypothetical protein